MRALAALPALALLVVAAAPASAAGSCAATGPSNRFLHLPDAGRALSVSADLAGDYVHVLGTGRAQGSSVAVLRWSCSEQTTLPLPQIGGAAHRRT